VYCGIGALLPPESTGPSSTADSAFNGKSGLSERTVANNMVVEWREFTRGPVETCKPTKTKV
jgi:hypothetical protein